MRVMAVFLILLLGACCCKNLTDYSDDSIDLNDCSKNMNTYFECQSILSGGSPDGDE